MMLLLGALLAPASNAAATVLEPIVLGRHFGSERLSGDGTTVVATTRVFDDDGNYLRNDVIRWNAGQSTAIATGVPSGISRDGSMVVGSPGTTAGGGWVWTPDGLSELPEPPPGYTLKTVNGITDDGSVIVGHFNERSRFRLIDGEYTVIDDFGILTSISSVASGDPEIMAGFAGTRAVLLLDDGFAPLPPFHLGLFSYVTDLSADGRVAVGSVDRQAYRWTDGVAVPMQGALAAGVSRDGRRIVGRSSNGDGAFYWSELLGEILLSDVLARYFDVDLSGWTLIEATGISDDGRVLMGIGRFEDEEFGLWRVELPTTIEQAVIPEPSTGLLVGLGLTAIAWRRRVRMGRRG